jgi:reductive dehalogenase
MRKLSLEQWESRYIAGRIEPFDQKNTMFNRPGWDPEVIERLADWSFTGRAKNKPGYTLQDLALKYASKQGQQFVLFNTSKPNTSALAQSIDGIMSASTPGTKAWDYRPSEGARIATDDSEEITSKLKKAALYFGADLAGVAPLDRRFVYSHTCDQMGPGVSRMTAPIESRVQVIPGEFNYSFVMAFAEDYELLRYYPTCIADATTSRGYSRMAITSHYLAYFIRALGFKAIDCTNNDVVLSVPLAMLAGLGDLGRHGLLITPRFGPRVRLSVVLTDLPLVVDSPIDFGVAEFCEVCHKCAERCPSRSISRAAKTSEVSSHSNSAGALKWPVNVEECRAQWARTGKECTICVAVCPYNKPDTLIHRGVRWFTDRVRWADPFYVMMDDLLGYGKSRKADNFWNEWRP